MKAAKMKKGEKRRRGPARKRKENHVIRRKGDNKFNDLNYYLIHTMSRCFDPNYQRSVGKLDTLYKSHKMHIFNATWAETNL